MERLLYISLGGDDRVLHMAGGSMRVPTGGNVLRRAGRVRAQQGRGGEGCILERRSDRIESRDGREDDALSALETISVHPRTGAWLT